MYRYSDSDRQLVRQRADEFRDQVRRFQAGELSDDAFMQLRLRNGLYLQRHAYMLRVAIPYGLMSSRQLRRLAHIARRYDRGYGHFSTRQNIQFNWPELDDVADILDQLAEVDMHAIQTSGNVVRNVTTDPLAGVAPDEIDDPRPYCELLRQWSTLHPEFNWLPRKFKIAVTGATEDRAAVQLHDIGLRIVRNDTGAVGFEVLVGGGQGRTPVIGKTIREFLPAGDLLSYVEAILRIYNLEGRRDNLYKARIKILVNTLGIDVFRDKVEREWQRIRHGALELPPATLDDMRAQFAPPVYRAAGNGDNDLGHDLAGQQARNPLFAQWLKHNTREHRVAGYRIVFVSLKAPGVPPGDITAQQMDALALLADQYSFGRIRSTHDQNLVLADVQEAHLYALWRALRPLRLATANIGSLNDMICCPGLDFCNLANAGSIDVARAINERFDDLDYLHDLGEIQLKMSGCMNACGHHHVGHIGILGVEKNGAEWYQLSIGGSAANDATLGQRLGRAVSKHELVDAVDALIQVYVAHRLADERFIDTFRRIGVQPFRERIYGRHRQTPRRRQSVAA